IDIGGGDGRLVDSLLNLGYQNIWVLDISAKAIERAKTRLGQKAAHVQWIVNDVTTFIPPVRFDCWHDRATFHFLVSKEQILKYLTVARQSTSKGSYAIIGLFSQNGPKKCSGLEVKQYTEEALTEQLGNDFKKIKCITEDHKTPFNTNQNFLYCSFKRN
ncbi:MAG: class I SAM-dependent methyltransferase, partial [Bacteroidota bacterium]|nr:class I SAM-dependent methyltransferase [Bacteroidota bacterium]